MEAGLRLLRKMAAQNLGCKMQCTRKYLAMDKWQNFSSRQKIVASEIF